MRDAFARANLSGKLTLYGVSLATLHLILAGLGVGNFFELWPAAWPFYGGLIGITTTAGVVLHTQKRRLAARMPDPAGEIDE